MLAPFHCLLFHNTLGLILGVFSIHIVDLPNTLASKFLTPFTSEIAFPLISASHPCSQTIDLLLPMIASFHNPIFKYLLLLAAAIFVTYSPD